MLLRSIVFNIAFYVNFLVQAVLFSPVLLLPERFFWPIGRFWVALLALAAPHDLRRRRRDTRAREHPGRRLSSSPPSISRRGRRSASFELFPRPSFILKRQLLWIPLFGWYMWKAHMIPVDRSKGSAAIDDDARAMPAGQSPRNARSSSFRKARADCPARRRNIVRASRGSIDALAVPCLPIALNSGLFWPRRSLLHRPGTILAEILSPIPPGLDSEDFAMEVQHRIEEATAKLLKESAVGAATSGSALQAT